ncbi:hypothetical protein [Sorangium sp. So ce131]|uniref:hypothetical protein n=1 Tax=Sorangium sp. So ce131 TaxID=3133282 RepID=UPI003F61FDC2
MDARLDARRAKVSRRSGERGAAVFIVVLVISMLTAIGVFAAHAATLSTIASGHERQMTQTHYVTEYAMSLVLADLERAGSLNEIDAAVRQSTLAGSPPQCSVPTLDTTPYCFSFIPRTLQAKAAENLVEPPVPGNPVADEPGSLGLSDVSWNFKVELADKTAGIAGPAGMDETSAGAANVKYCMVTLNARGLVWPSATSDEADDIAIAGSQESLSAHLTLPCSTQ